MKGSTNAQSASQGSTSGQSQQQNYWSSPVGKMMQSFAAFHAPVAAPLLQQRNSGSGSKGSAPAQQQAAAPALPEYVNYQQMPTYSSQPAGPSQALLNFLSSNYGSGYASGGAAKQRSLDDDIEAAMRIVRLLGELKKT